MERIGRVIAALAVSALPILIVATADGTATAECSPGSGQHLAGQRITAAEVARYQGTSGLECADLARANLSGLSLIQFDLTRANLRHADLSHANLTQATLTGAAMQGGNLRSADLTQATMNRVNLADADLRYAKLGQAELKGADLASATLVKASLTEVGAQGANFRRANLTDADLSGATLTGAHFNGAKLKGASFIGATGAPAGRSGGITGVSAPAVSVSKKNLQEYLLGGAALIFVLLSLGSVRRYFYTRTTGSFFGASGAGYGGFAGPGNYGAGYASPWGGQDASGYGGGQPTPTTPFIPTRAAPYGPMPTAFAGRWRGAGRSAKLALAILGALVVAIALWLIGTTVVGAILVPAGKAGYRLCESTCGSRFADHGPAGLIVGVILLAFGGTLRAIGRIRY